MKILLSGGTGFIGEALMKHLIAQGHQLYSLTRGETRKENGVQYVQWFQNDKQELTYFQDTCIDVCINLAGEPIQKGRWTKRKKERILQSRLQATQRMMALVRSMKQKPHTFIQGSAVGYYGYSQVNRFTEESDPLLNSFPSKVCQEWEKTFDELQDNDIRKVIARIGIVLDHHGGALEKLLFPHKWFVGGRIASGEQWLSWIHLQDIIRLFDYIIHHSEISGPINMTAPNPISMDEFGRTIASVLKRPYWFPVPSPLLRTVFGQISESLIHGQYVIPEKALKSGFTFQFDYIESATREILG